MAGLVTTVVARLLGPLALAGIGWLTALALDVRGVDASSGYFLLATVLLAIGLFSSTYDIAIGELKKNIRIVLVAITLGVLAKAALIAAVMYVVLGGGSPAYLVLGVAMAQIDPLSVALTRHQSQLSERAKAILSAWSALDDPVTALLAVYLSFFALNQTAIGVAEPGGADAEAMGLSAFLEGLVGNGLLVAGTLACWWVLFARARRTSRGLVDGADHPAWGLRAAGVLVLVVATAVAVNNFWLLGLAVAGLFFRPGIGRALAPLTLVAFGVAAFVLGIVLADGVALVTGVILGFATFGAQMVVAGLVTWRLPRSDAIRLALGQQSGITAVILALLLETMFPGTVAIVAPAILVINILYFVSNTALDRVQEHIRRARVGPAPPRPEQPARLLVDGVHDSPATSPSGVSRDQQEHP